MFPRLHVNDKEKGGPRAPPRNKMALYEQLSIPSQRFSSGFLPPNSLQTFSSKGISDAGKLFFPLHSSPTEKNRDGKLRPHFYTGADFGSPGTQIIQEKREGDGDDCSVPVFVQSGAQQNVTKGGKVDSATPKPFKQQQQGGRNSGRGRIFSPDTNSKELKDLAVVSTSATDNAVGPEIQSCSDENHAHPKESDGAYVKRDSPDKGKIDRIDSVSEVSMVDSISCSDISPDDIVALIGQRSFWKARETIANQQRVFAFQLFELHRLIKVQKSIAKSPQLFIEDNIFLKSSTRKDSSTTKRSSTCIDKLPLPVMNSEALRKSNRKMECSAENAVDDNTCLYVAKNGHYSGTPHQNTASWCFPHSTPHQWLIPVMSPSQGLVYKPCPAPAFIGTFPPPYSSSQSMGGFANPTQENSIFPINTPYNIAPVNSTVSGSVPDQPKSSSCSVPGQTHGLDRQNGVIKAVPRNPRSAVKSAARIFQSIQEERKLQSM